MRSTNKLCDQPTNTEIHQRSTINQTDLRERTQLHPETAIDQQTEILPLVLARLGCLPRGGARCRRGSGREGPGKGDWRGEAHGPHRLHATVAELHLCATVSQQAPQHDGGPIQVWPLEEPDQ